MADAQDESLLTFNFSKGINEYKDETLLDIDEAAKTQNVSIDGGILSTVNEPSTVSTQSGIKRLAKYFSGDDCTLIPLTTNSDYLNYQAKDDEVMLIGDGVSPVKVYDGSSYRDMKNERIEQIESLNIPPLVADMTVSVGGGTKEGSIKIRNWVPTSYGKYGATFIRRSSDSHVTDVGEPVPFDAIPYINESDVLDVYVGEYITLYTRGTGTFMNNNNENVTYSSPVILDYICFPVDAETITTKIITPTTFTEPVPKGNLIELNHERVWLAGDSDYPNRVYFSKDMDFDDWTIPTSETESNQHGGLVDLPTWDGGRIVGMRVLFGDLFVFKEKHIFRIFGTYPGNYTSEQVCTMTGTISDRSIAASPSAVFLAADDGIYSFNGTSPTHIGQRIRKTWETLNQDYIKNSVGIFYKNKYYLAVPEGASTVNNLIIEYNTEMDSFVFIRGITVKDFIEFEGNMYFSNSTGIYNMFQLDEVNANGYEAIWTTGKLNFGATNAKKATQRLYFLASGSGSVQISITNEKGKVKSKIFELTNTETAYRKRLKNKGRTLQFDIQSVDGSKFKLKDMQIVYEADAD